MRVRCRDALRGKHGSRWKDVITARAKTNQGAIMLVLDLVKSFKRVSLPVVGLGGAFQFSQKDFACAVRVLQASAESTVRGKCGGADANHHKQESKLGKNASKHGVWVLLASLNTKKSAHFGGKSTNLLSETKLYKHG